MHYQPLPQSLSTPVSIFHNPAKVLPNTKKKWQHQWPQECPSTTSPENPQISDALPTSTKRSPKIFDPKKKKKKKNLCFNYQIFFFGFLKFDYVFVQIFGFEEIESPNFLEFKVIWLNLPSAFQLHLIERNPSNNLPEGPWSATSPVVDPSHLPRGHHICFTVSNLDSFLQSLKVKYSFLFFFSFFTLHLFRILLLVILFGANQVVLY